MNAKQAVAQRILELCKNRSITVNTLANDAGIPPTTIYSILNTKSKNPGIVTIKQVCDGMDISLREFFDSPIFDELEQEIQ
ncbi:MAG: helix-turn-helix domain-containing protein [Ruthenibacterium lactatiformans]|jgi:transcriptional regulator with XRE-family HTH domain